MPTHSVMDQCRQVTSYKPSTKHHDGEIVYVADLRNYRKEKTMKAATFVGILFIVLGIGGFALGGISFTQEKKDVDMGPVQLSHKQTKRVPISPIFSTLALVGGLAILVAGSRDKN